jgi:hypothetical protein
MPLNLKKQKHLQQNPVNNTFKILYIPAKIAGIFYLNDQIQVPLACRAIEYATRIRKGLPENP